MSFVVPGDLLLNEDESDLVLVQGLEEIRAAADSALQTFKRTWRYDLNAGAIDTATVLEKGAQRGPLRAAIWRTLSRLEGIERVLGIAVSYDPVERAAAVTWSAQTVAGAVTSTVRYT